MVEKKKGQVLENKEVLNLDSNVVEVIEVKKQKNDGKMKNIIL